MATAVSEHQRKRLRAGDEIVRFPSGDRASSKDFENVDVALFVHGFTADANYMSVIMQQFHESGYKTLAFNYGCFHGIDIAAESLKGLLHFFDNDSLGAVSRNRVVLVCHSMGALVARAFIALKGGHKYAKKVITLGGPHLGTLSNNMLLQFLLSWSEFIGGMNPTGYSAKSKSGLQLIGQDGSPSLLDTLRKASPPSNRVDFYSVSGGHPRLEFGTNPAKNWFANHWIQTQMRGQQNDGLVSERSSNLAQPDFARCAPNSRHKNDYAEFDRTNHSNLIFNQTIALYAIECARSG